MPDFRVIEGGGKGRQSVEEYLARKAFRRFVIELLRALARENDNGVQSTHALIDFIEKVSIADVPILPIIGDTISEFHDLAFEIERIDDHEAEIKGILEAALKVIVEYLADDGFAKGRRSKRQDGLRHTIEAKLLRSEQRSREAGWSYLKSLSDRVGKWQPRKK